MNGTFSGDPTPSLNKSSLAARYSQALTYKSWEPHLLFILLELLIFRASIKTSSLDALLIRQNCLFVKHSVILPSKLQPRHTEKTFCPIPHSLSRGRMLSGIRVKSSSCLAAITYNTGQTDKSNVLGVVARIRPGRQYLNIKDKSTVLKYHGTKGQVRARTLTSRVRSC